MTRRKPISNKQKKAELQLHRAIKRNANSETSSGRHDNVDSVNSDLKSSTKLSKTRQDISKKASSRLLQSSYARIPPEYLDYTKLLASTSPLLRPIPTEMLLFPEDCMTMKAAKSMKLLKRPKWKHDMTKKQVESNEEALFSRWLNETDNILDSLQSRGAVPLRVVSNDDRFQEQHAGDSKLENNRGYVPRHYERNIEVWRQLWRVMEISQIFLVLLDCRCPLLHFPPSLHEFLSSFGSTRRSILVLTKIDVAGPIHSSAWVEYLKSQFPDMILVEIESYVEDHISERRSVTKNPRLSSRAKKDLIEALRKAHEKLCMPPIKLKNNEEKLAAWNPSVPKTINWDACFAEQPVVASNKFESTNYLTIGLIGQPNVGKSSLLNALFGCRKVKASHTPGKTKHLQTLFLTPEIRLVDCPGLVFPNYHRLEMQVLSGIIPISQVSSIASCISYALQYIPLERILNLDHSSLSEPSEFDKRTWREEVCVRKQNRPIWTAMDVLVVYANLKGWNTAKAGRPDINRAGNALLRALARAQIKWAFLPPDFKLDTLSESQRENGIWLPSEFKYEDDASEEDATMQAEYNANLSRTSDLSDNSESENYSEIISQPLYGKYELLADKEEDGGQ